MSIGYFLGGIAAIIRHPATNRYLILRRSVQKDVGAGKWECVTGRVDQGESYEQALFREVQEEVGVSVRLELLVGTTHFYRGAPIPENELNGVIYCCALDDPDSIRMSHEHDALHWMTAVQLHDFLPQNHWLLPYINRAELLLAHTPPELIERFGKEGFDFF